VKTAILVAALLLVHGVLLLAQGRPLWCACGSLAPWSGDIWSGHNSQHLLDPYSFTHVLHGMLLYALGWQLAGRPAAPLGFMPLASRFGIAVALETAWEQLENSAWIVERYRANTIALGYLGDSVLNSMGDILCCAVGFWLAARLPARATVFLFVVVEVGLLLLYRDSLLLSFLMLVWPVPAIRHWQAG
jgi:hypothetical protein